ncbi:hypothetical protein VTH06DRAFT_4185 [Thermothelomyces fergusii]
MLVVFLGPTYRDWWLSYIKDPEELMPRSSHWLVQRSAAEAFARELVRLEVRRHFLLEFDVDFVQVGPEKPLRVQGSCALLGDHSRSGISKVDFRLVGTQARLARSIRYVEIAKRIAPQILPRQLGDPAPPATDVVRASSGHFLPWAWPSPLISGPAKSLINLLGRSLISSLRILPRRARAVAYEALRKLGERLYGRDDESNFAQRLPFGLFLKHQSTAAVARNEFNAMRIVRQRTSIPVPRPLDVVSDGDDSFLLMTEPPGAPLWRCQEVFSDTECDAIVAQLKDFVSQLRDIPKTVNPDAQICNSLGEACRDSRIRLGNPVGPFADEAAFSQLLAFSDEPSRRGHKIVFTHADFNPRNILVDQVALPDGTTG